MTDKASAVAAKLRTLQDAFAAQLPERLAAIEQAWSALRSTDKTSAPNHDLSRLIHSLAGAAGTFGYRRLGEQARELEIALSALPLEWHAQPEVIATLDGALSRLKGLAAEGADNTFVATPTTRQQTADPATLDKTLIYVLEDDPLQAQEIGNQLEHFGYSVSCFSTGSELVHAQERRPADAFLLDINLPEGELEGLRIAPRLQALGVIPAPSVFISARTDWQARLAALRAGGRAYFAKPLDFAALVEQLDLLVKRKVQEPTVSQARNGSWPMCCKRRTPPPAKSRRRRVRLAPASVHDRPGRAVGYTG